MKILFLGAFGKGALENYYLKSLTESNVVIDTYDICKDYYNAINRSVFHKGLNKVLPSSFFKGINESVLEKVKNEKYQVILIFKGFTLFPETVKALKEHTYLLCNYNPDHPFLFFSPGSGNKNIIDCIPLYDVYITFAKKIARELQLIYNSKAFVLPFGYDDKQQRTIYSDINKGKIIFIGAYDKERADYCNKIETEQLVIYGERKWASRTIGKNKIRSAFSGRALYGDEYAGAIASANGVLNILRRQNLDEHTHNMRTFEVPGYGGVLISNRTQEQMEFFEEGKEAVYFDSMDELNEKILFLQKSPSVVEAIKKAALLRSEKSNYGYTHRAKEMLEIFKKHLS
jgi:spore maturation protein CgeB